MIENVASSARTIQMYIFLYSEIINHQETRNLYIITCTHNRVILIDKNGFTINHWIPDKKQI